MTEKEICDMIEGRIESLTYTMQHLNNVDGSYSVRFGERRKELITILQEIKLKSCNTKNSS